MWSAAPSVHVCFTKMSICCNQHFTCTQRGSNLKVPFWGQWVVIYLLHVWGAQTLVRHCSRSPPWAPPQKILAEFEMVGFIRQNNHRYFPTVVFSIKSHLQALVNRELLVPQCQQVVNLLIVDLHIGHPNQELAIRSLLPSAPQRSLYLTFLFPEETLKTEPRKQVESHTILVVRNTSSTARGMIPGSPSDPLMVKVLPLLVWPYAKAVPGGR